MKSSGISFKIDLKWIVRFLVACYIVASLFVMVFTVVVENQKVEQLGAQGQLQLQRVLHGDLEVQMSKFSSLNSMPIQAQLAVDKEDHPSEKVNNPVIKDGAGRGDSPEQRDGSADGPIAASGSIELYPHSVTQTHTSPVLPQLCSYLNQGRTRTLHPAVPCASRVEITQQWSTRDKEPITGCPEPGYLGVITSKVWMLAWQVTITARYRFDPSCQTVLWMSVDCNVDYAFGWDIKITKCEPTPAQNSPTWYRYTTFTAAWDAYFLHQSIGVIKFSHCYRSGANPRNPFVAYQFGTCNPS